MSEVSNKELEPGIVKTECSDTTKPKEFSKQLELSHFKTEAAEPIHEENLFIKNFELDLGILKPGINSPLVNKDLSKDGSKETVLDITKEAISDVGQGGSLVWGGKYGTEGWQMWCNDCGSLNTSPLLVARCTPEVKQEEDRAASLAGPCAGLYDCRTNPYLKFAAVRDIDYAAIELRYAAVASQQDGKTFYYDRKKPRCLKPPGPSPDLIEPLADDTSGDKPYSCETCDYKTTQRSKLKSHSRTHTGEKPYSCLMCDYRASLRYTLKKHMRTHTGEKPYPCDLCDYRASHKYTLKKHMLTHTGEKPYSCRLCDYRASLRYTLKKHMMTHSSSDSGYTCRLNAFGAI